MAREKPYYCDDWGCPAWVSCKHAFGRSKAYAAMSGGEEPKRYRLSSIERDGFYDRRLREWCEQYEFDKPKPWLKGWFDQHAAGSA
jgi:hypothetical protein